MLYEFDYALLLARMCNGYAATYFVLRFIFT
jgi:hypothetical protein